MPNTRYIPGEWNVICPLCGFQFKASQMKTRWDGQRVCAKDWDPYHPQDLVRAVEDNPAVPWSYPEQAFNFLEDTGPLTQEMKDSYPHSVSSA